MTQTLGHAQMHSDPLTYRQGPEILQKLDLILAHVRTLSGQVAVDRPVPTQLLASVPEPEKTGLDLFWSLYPRKIGKGAAELAWKKLKPDVALQARIIQAVKAQCKSEQWRRDGGQFIPHPATWLNGKRWEDEVEVKIAQDKPPVFYRTLPPRPEGEACPPEAKAVLSKLLGKDFSL